MRRSCLFLGVYCLLPTAVVQAEPSLSGQTGYIHMPSALVERDATWKLGVSYEDPYFTLYNNVSVLPFLEVGLRMNQIRGVRAFDFRSDNTESYKDEAFDLKLRLTEEIGMLPAVSVGVQDYFGTRLFPMEYVVATKTFGDLEVSLGYAPDKLTFKSGNNEGNERDLNRAHGVFWGARWRVSDNLNLVVEKNAIDYSRDAFAAQTKVDESRDSNISFGAEYRWNWLGTQLAYQGGSWSINSYVQIPMWEREFVPKADEPAPYREVLPRPTRAMWESDSRYKRSMVAALQKQGFLNVEIRFDDTDVMHVVLGNKRISKMSRAVGRAVRTVLLLSPASTREIRVTYLEGGLPLATYEFFDLALLNRYLSGLVTRQQLANGVNLRFSSPQDVAAAGEGVRELVGGIEEERENPIHIVDNESGNLLAVRSVDSDQSFVFVPFKLSTFSKSSSGYFQYELYSALNYSRKLGDGWSLGGSLSLKLDDNYEDFNDDPKYASQINVVRSDQYEYVQDQTVRLDRLYLNKSVQLAPRQYARITGGMLESMYGGIEAQWLYFPEHGPWAFDLTIDAVQKREPDSTFGFRDYKTVTALGALHYRLPLGFEVTTRVGRFLAKDWGARFEFSRRFPVGIEAGAWYTVTDANDLTAPGSYGEPYRDKGVFLRIPFNSLTTKDTRSVGTFAFQEWGRDVGQMVDSPIDLYWQMRNGLINKQDIDGLRELADVYDDPRLPSLGTSMFERNMWKLASNDLGNGLGLLGSGDTWMKLGVGLGVTGLSAVLDEPGERWASKYGSNKFANGLANVGNALPLLALGVAGLAAFDPSDARFNMAGTAALQASGVGIISALGLKYAVGRARPDAGLGAGHFTPFSKDNGDTSFPSIHTTAMWAAVTPFAKEYDMPWLYGVAALTNYARVAKDKHWVSDTVAGALLGYWLGDTFWHWRRGEMLKRAELVFGPNTVGLSWPIQ